jgi:hypothetical protein
MIVAVTLGTGRRMRACTAKAKSGLNSIGGDPAYFDTEFRVLETEKTFIFGEMKK